MEKGREALVRAGWRPADIAVKIHKKRRGIARDILKEARDGGYDTLVIGRRGLSGIKEFLFGSVSNKILQMAEGMAVVLVD
jgi:nucleotide-binding universal stress UspA family protein